jgi:hypothetical protein
MGRKMARSRIATDRKTEPNRNALTGSSIAAMSSCDLERNWNATAAHRSGCQSNWKAGLHCKKWRRSRYTRDSDRAHHSRRNLPKADDPFESYEWIARSRRLD